MKLYYKRRRLLGNNGAACMATLLLLISGANAQRFPNSQPPDSAPPKKAARPKPSAPPLVLDKKLFFQSARLGMITAILPYRRPSDSLPALEIAGDRGAAAITAAGKTLSFVQFQRPGGRFTPVDMDGDGRFEFLSRGNGQEEARLFDREGREVWKYGLGDDPAVEDATCGDLNGDGRAECVVGLRGYGGLRLLDRNGKELWRKPDANVWHVEVLDWDGNGKREILHSNGAGRVRIRNADGNLVREIPGNNYIALFSLCRWQNPDSGWFILNNNNRTGIQVIDSAGRVVASLNTATKGYEAYGTPVRFKAGGVPYFALLLCRCVPDRDSRLFIYNPDGDLVYEETLPASEAALLTQPAETPGAQTLLVGEGEGKIWQYFLPSVQHGKSAANP